MNNKKEILQLTSLRFLAALYVFLFHIHIRWPLTDIRFLKNILEQGAVGMSVFFVLSGFILAYRYAGNKESTKDYFINRFARIYPIYMTAAIVTLPWMGIDFSANTFSSFFKEIGKFFFLVFTNMFLIQAWFIQLINYWNDGASWSISVEMFFYSLIPFILRPLSRLSMKQMSIFCFICWVLAVLPGLSAGLFKTPASGIFYSMPIFRLPEFMLGVCTFFMLGFDLTKNIRKKHQVLFVSVFFIYLGLVGSKAPLYVGHNWILVPFISFVIYSLVKNSSSSWLSHSFFVYLGKVSYCFYSFQALVILSFISHHSKIIHYFPLMKSNKLLCFVAFFILLFISIVGHRFIEEPSRIWIRGYFKEKNYTTRSINFL